MKTRSTFVSNSSSSSFLIAVNCEKREILNSPFLIDIVFEKNSLQRLKDYYKTEKEYCDMLISLIENVRANTLAIITVDRDNEYLVNLFDSYESQGKISTIKMVSY